MNECLLNKPLSAAHIFIGLLGPNDAQVIIRNAKTRKYKKNMLLALICLTSVAVTNLKKYREIKILFLLNCFA